MKSDKEIGSMIQRELNGATTYTQTELEENQRQALEYYNNEPRGDEVVGRSTQQSTDVSDTVDHLLAELMPQFEAGIFEFLLEDSSDDEDQSRLESAAVNDVFFDQNDGWYRNYEAFKDALLMRNGYFKATFDETWSNPELVTFEGTAEQIEMQRQQLAANPDIKVEMTEAETVTLTIQDPMGVFQVEGARVEFKIIRKKRKVNVDTVAPEQMRVNSSHWDLNLQTAGMVAEERIMSEADMLAFGFLEEDVKTCQRYAYGSNEVQNSRSRSRVTPGDEGGSKSTIMRVFYECYYRVDQDEDGISELRKIFFGGNRIMRWQDGSSANEIASIVPYSSISPYIMPHRHIGTSSFDKMKSVQDFGTSLIRGMQTNLDMSNHTEKFVQGDVSKTVLRSRAGNVISGGPNSMVTNLPPVPMMANSLQALQYKDKLRDERGGSAISSGPDMGAPTNVTASAFERHMTSIEKMAALIATTFCKTGLRHLGLIIHETMRQNIDVPIEVPEGGEFKQVIPAQWRPRERIKIRKGMGYGERMRKGQALGIVLQNLERAEAGGTVIATEEGAYEAMMDQARCAGLDKPDQYYRDPQSEEAAQERQRRAKAAEEQRAQQEAAQQALLQAQATIVQMQEQSDIMQQRMKSETDLIKQQMSDYQDTMDRLVKLLETEEKYNTDLGVAPRQVTG